MREGVDYGKYYQNMTHLSNFAERYNIRVNYVNLKEYKKENDLAFQKFVGNYLIKNGKRKIKKEKTNEKISCEFNIQSQVDFDHKIIQARDMSSSPKSKKKDNCTLF